MTVEEFQNFLRQRKYDELLGPCLRDEETPYAFAPRPSTWGIFRDGLASALHVEPGEIRVVGSGRVGFSMRPFNNLAAFGDTSDVDIVVVNEGAFDRLWTSLLRAAYPRGPVVSRLGGWLRERRKEVYTGWLSPLAMHLDRRIHGEKAKPVLDIKTQWFNALKLASRLPPRRHENVTGRLYRTWLHVELYHLDSLAALRHSLFD
jgi:hypothetical protein